MSAPEVAVFVELGRGLKGVGYGQLMLGAVSRTCSVGLGGRAPMIATNVRANVGSVISSIGACTRHVPIIGKAGAEDSYFALW